MCQTAMLACVHPALPCPTLPCPTCWHNCAWVAGEVPEVEELRRIRLAKRQRQKMETALAGDDEAETGAAAAATEAGELGAGQHCVNCSIFVLACYFIDHMVASGPYPAHRDWPVSKCKLHCSCQATVPRLACMSHAWQVMTRQRPAQQLQRPRLASLEQANIA